MLLGWEASLSLLGHAEVYRFRALGTPQRRVGALLRCSTNKWPFIARATALRYAPAPEQQKAPAARPLGALLKPAWPQPLTVVGAHQPSQSSHQPGLQQQPE